jgi:AraC-like DNA-binding protein
MEFTVNFLRKSPWNMVTVNRPVLSLDEREPFRTVYRVYEKKAMTMFDMHYALEIGVIVRGRMHRYYRDWETQLGPGEAWLCGMWEPHGFKILDAPCGVMAIIFWPPALAAMKFRELPDFDWIAPFVLAPEFRPTADPRTRERILSVAGRAIEAIELGGKYAQIRYRLLLMEILLLLCETWKAPKHPDYPPGDSFLRINRALQLVFGSRRVITAQEAARACGLCRNTFGKLFRNLMGTGFPDFGLRYRLHGAASELQQTTNPVKAVARQWGFTDTSHLHRCFVTYYGCSPAQYRRRMASI